jgi:hypothetical protein
MDDDERDYDLVREAIDERHARNANRCRCPCDMPGRCPGPAACPCCDHDEKDA